MAYPRPKWIDWTQPINWDASLNRGLVSWWMVGPDSPYFGGSKILDLLGKSHGTIAPSGPTWNGLARPGGFGSILYPNTDVYVTAPAVSAISGGDNLTVACWVKPLSSGGGGFGRFFNSDDTTPFGFLMNGSTTSISWCVNGTPLSGTVPSGVWLHVCGVYERPTQRLYVNGVQVASATLAGALATCNTIYFNGRSSGGRAFDGYGDDYKLWTRALSTAEVAGLYTASFAGYPSEFNWIRCPLVFDVGGGGGPIGFKSAWAIGCNILITPGIK